MQSHAAPLGLPKLSTLQSLAKHRGSALSLQAPSSLTPAISPLASNYTSDWKPRASQMHEVPTKEVNLVGSQRGSVSSQNPSQQQA